MSHDFDRRTLLKSIAAAVGGAALGSSASVPVAAASGTAGACDSDLVGDLVFNETSSLLDSNFDRLTDDGRVVVYSGPSAEAGSYDDEPVPLLARDGPVFGSGSLLVNDDEDNCLDYGQDAMLLNIIDSYTGGSGTIIYDESADQDYTLAGNFSKFETWAGGEGYEVTESDDLSADLDTADALLVTLPGEEHGAEQIDAIRDFAAAGNPVFLFNEADSWDTDDLNYLAEELGLAFRFDDDEVTDELGWEWDDWPITRNYDAAADPGWFAYRESMGFDPGTEYEAEIVEVLDGDTFDVRIAAGLHEGEEERIRHLGQDTPETGSTQNDSDEWRGIESENYLDDWGSAATDYAEDNFDEGDVITFWVDRNEHPPRGTYGRLLAFHSFPEGHAREADTYNLAVIEEGYAKPYNSSFSTHPEYESAYREAYDAGRRVWGEADAEATGEVDNDPVESLRFRAATPIDGASDAETAVDSGRGDTLVGVDESRGVALVGGLMNADNWESGDDGNFVFNANLARELSGEVADNELMIEGGHGQFAASYDFSFEGKEAYHRFIEGLDAMWFQAVNELSATSLDTERGRHALVITPPDIDVCYTSEEIDALQAFLDDGGAVILKANTEVDAASVGTLNELATELGTDLQFSGDAMGDVETSTFNEEYDLFDPYDTDGTGSGGDEDEPAEFAVTVDEYDEEVVEGADVDVAYTVDNTGDDGDTQDVVFSVDGATEAIEEDVTLGGGDSYSSGFTYTTVEGDSPEITVEVATEDDAASRTVTVTEDDGGGEATVLEADPDSEETASFHVWTLADPSDEFDGEADVIGVDYPAGTSMDGLTNEDVSVYMDRDGDGSVDEVSVNSDEYAGSSAVFDLDGRFNTAVEGEVRVEIDGVVNPEAGEYVATIELDGDDIHAVDAAYEVTADGTATPTIDRFDVTDDSNNAWSRFGVDWGVSHDDGDLATVTSALLDGTGEVLDSVTSDVSGTEASGSHDLESRDDASEVRLTVTDGDGDETVDRTDV